MIRSEPHIPPAECEAREIAPGVLWMQMPLPFKPDTVNCYALRDADGWTLRSADGSNTAHSEHTIAVTEDGPRVLTAVAD